MTVLKLREPQGKLEVQSLGEALRNSEPEIIFALKEEYLEEKNMGVLLKYNPYMIMGLVNPTYEMCLGAIKADGELYMYVPDEFKSDIEIKLAAIKQNQYVIEQMIQFNTATADLIDMAVTMNPKTIKVIFNGSDLLSAIHYMSDYYKFDIEALLEQELYVNVFSSVIQMALNKRKKDKSLKNYREILIEWYAKQI